MTIELGVNSQLSISSTSSKRRRNFKKTPNGESSPGNPKNKFTYFAASGLSDDRWLCPICLDIFEDAVETPCCHNLFCEACIKRTPTCPLCNLRINPLDGLKPNIPIRRLVMELSVPCPNDDCDKIIRKGEQEKHLKECNFTPVVCPNNEGHVCGLILRRDIERHKNEECPFRIVECLLRCGVMLPLNDMDEHITNDCPKTIIKCKNNCGGKIERGNIEKHIT
jgi:TNF receptor-associated factor 4